MWQVANGLDNAGLESAFVSVVWSEQNGLSKYMLRLVATHAFSLRLLYAIAFSKKLCWFEPIDVITLKIQQHAVNAR